MSYIQKEYSNLSEVEKNLIMENAKLEAVIETIEKYRPLIEFEGKESKTARLFSDLLISILKDYDNIKSNLLKEQISDYVLCKSQQVK
ncbi:hypothetical protein [Clostridium sp. JN-9]|uniref:hypothetical protein n=1 Tax=Clostridium sp. JN-9 TaxID=2507159 RepID=UPI000FFE227D|nr:hypothetical protein [Clostridium sp. JN-9]QAT40877.1 hypothetical protein EQM05_11715 [Clostridium sp. JN-9]